MQTESIDTSLIGTPAIKPFIFGTPEGRSEIRRLVFYGIQRGWLSYYSGSEEEAAFEAGDGGGD